MQYRKLKGTAIFDGTCLLEKQVLVLTTDGTIQDIIPFDEADAAVETVEGLLCPGFINAHCHLELSHLKGVVSEGTGLVNFLITVIGSRDKDTIDRQEFIKAAEAEMYNNGIAGVADICNTADTVKVKKSSRLKWHNLVEVINFNDAHLEKALVNYNAVKKDFEYGGLTAVLTPHAPYSISAATYKAINSITQGSVISMHNQETRDENTLFKNGRGDFLRLYARFGNVISPFPISGKSSLQTWLPHFTNGQTIILVHNTFTSEEDIVFAKAHSEKYGLKLVYCLCPNANLYIEGCLPAVDLFIKHNCHIVVGTDSYSSNHQLSIASELQTLRIQFPHLPINNLLRWATYNGAATMGWNDLGSFKKGTQPGIICINEKNFTVQRLS